MKNRKGIAGVSSFKSDTICSQLKNFNNFVTKSTDFRIISTNQLKHTTMGYTHYFKGTKSTDAKFKEFSNACKKLHDNLPEKTDTAGGYHKDDKLIIGDGRGHLHESTGDVPIFDNRMVCFNGVGELAHETFRIEKKGTNDFCKTARKPYDLLVVACLIAAWQILNYRFSSDGFNSDGTCEDLVPAMKYYNEVMQPKNKITGLSEPITEAMLWEQRN